ncbi:hypothetical protein Hanom_Chr16g01492061 [Helianthus anomalus]
MTFILFRCAQRKLVNISIQNKGINWSSDKNLYWKHDVQQFEALKVILHGNAKFEAVDVNLEEPQKLLQPVDKTLKTMAIEFSEYQMYYYHPFYALSDPAKLYNDLRWNVTRPTGLKP